MRIDNLIQVSQLYSTQNTSGVKKTDAKGKNFKDEVQISSTAKDFQTVKNALAKTSDVRADRVTPLKESIENGTYDVSNEDLVDKLLSSFTL